MVTVIAIANHYKERRFRTHIRTLQNQGLGPSLFLQAQSVEELQYWVKTNSGIFGKDVAAIRSLLTILRFRSEDQADNFTRSPLLKLKSRESSMQTIVNSLLKQLERAMETRVNVVVGHEGVGLLCPQTRQ